MNEPKRRTPLWVPFLGGVFGALFWFGLQLIYIGMVK